MEIFGGCCCLQENTVKSLLILLISCPFGKACAQRIGWYMCKEAAAKSFPFSLYNRIQHWQIFRRILRILWWKSKTASISCEAILQSQGCEELIIQKTNPPLFSFCFCHVWFVFTQNQLLPQLSLVFARKHKGRKENLQKTIQLRILQKISVLLFLWKIFFCF